MLVTLYKIGEAHFRFLGTSGYHVKAKNERFSAAGSRCRQNLKVNMKIRVVAWPTTSKICSKKRAERAAWLFFLIQLIKSLIRGVVLAVAN